MIVRLYKQINKYMHIEPQRFQPIQYDDKNMNPSLHA